MPTERGEPRYGRPPGSEATGLVCLSCSLLLLFMLIHHFPSFTSIVARGPAVALHIRRAAGVTAGWLVPSFGFPKTLPLIHQAPSQTSFNLLLKLRLQEDFSMGRGEVFSDFLLFPPCLRFGFSFVGVEFSGNALFWSGNEKGLMSRAKLSSVSQNLFGELLLRLCVNWGWLVATRRHLASSPRAPFALPHLASITCLSLNPNCACVWKMEKLTVEGTPIKTNLSCKEGLIGNILLMLNLSETSCPSRTLSLGHHWLCSHSSVPLNYRG